jgi:hypothetical protein
VNDWIVEIEDVRDRARHLKEAIDEGVDIVELVAKGLLPRRYQRDS